MQVKADFELVRRQNQALVISALRRGGPAARSELGRKTALSPATITAITQDLLGLGVLRIADPAEVVDGRVRLGRPVTLLELNPAAASVLAIDISIDRVRFALAGYDGQVIDVTETSIPTFEANGRSFGRKLAADAGDYLRRHGVRHAARAAVSVQGIADMSTGTIAWSPAFRARDIAIRAPIERTLGIPTSIANDANLMALSVITRNPLAYAGTAAVAFVGAGVGMGLIINGRIYLGPTGAAAEFGHVNHMPSGPRCRCGSRGCIEAFAADYGIYRMAEGGDPDAEPPHRAIDPAVMRAVEARARAGDERARLAFRSAGLALGFGLARTIALLDVRRITLLGSGLRAADIIKPAIDEGLEQGLAAGLARGCVIEIGAIDHHDMAIDGLVTSLVADLDRDMIERPRADAATEVGELT